MLRRRSRRPRGRWRSRLGSRRGGGRTPTQRAGARRAARGRSPDGRRPTCRAAVAGSCRRRCEPQSARGQPAQGPTLARRPGPAGRARRPSGRDDRRGVQIRRRRSLVLQRLEDVQACSTACRKNRREQSRQDRRKHEDPDRAPRDGEDDPLVGERLGREDGKEDADHDSERASDQRGDDALVTDHPAHLPAGHPHSSQHPDLACPLEDREHERVHHAEQTDDHGEPEQPVEDVQELVDVVLLGLLELRGSLDLRVGERVQRDVQTRRVCVAHASLHVDQRHEVLRLRIVGVESRRGHRHWAERRATLGWIEDALQAEVESLSCRCPDCDRRTDCQVMLLRIVLVRESAVLAEVGRHAVPPSSQSIRTVCARFGETAVTWTFLSKTRASPPRIGETAVTPGVSAAASSACLTKGSKPFEAVSA